MLRNLVRNVVIRSESWRKEEEKEKRRVVNGRVTSEGRAVLSQMRGTTVVKGTA